MQPLLSIYIPTFNRMHHIKRQIKWVLNEIKLIDRNEIEIVVCDNHSTDGTKETINELINGSMIKYYCNSHNIGIVGNAYKSTDLTSGKYLWIISDDDHLRAGSIKHVISIIKNHPEISFIWLNYAQGPPPIKQIWQKLPFADKYYGDGFLELIHRYPSGLAMIIMTSSCIYLRNGVKRAQEVVKLGEIEAYSLNFFSSMTCMRLGASYFDTKVWVVADSKEVSWRDVAYEAHKGWLRSLERLTNVGYTKKEVRRIYHYLLRSSYFSDAWDNFKATKDLKVLMNDFFFFASRAPENVPSILLWPIYRRCVNLISPIQK